MQLQFLKCMMHLRHVRKRSIVTIDTFYGAGSASRVRLEAGILIPF